MIKLIVYLLYKIYYLLFHQIDTAIPDLNFSLPDYHVKLQQFISGIGYFLPLTAMGQLFAILIAYQAIRLALAFIRLFRR